MLLELALASNLLVPVELNEYSRSIVCGSYDEAKALMSGIGQVKKDSALGPNVEDKGGQSLVERWESKDGLYTIIQRWSNGNACIVVLGTQWKTLPENDI